MSWRIYREGLHTSSTAAGFSQPVRFVGRGRRFPTVAGQESERLIQIAAPPAFSKPGLRRLDRRELLGRSHHQELVHAGSFILGHLLDRRLERNR